MEQLVHRSALIDAQYSLDDARACPWAPVLREEDDAMNLQRWCAWVLAAVLAGAAVPLAAQSMTVFGSGENARRCSMAAEVAANMRVASSEDVEYCSMALELDALRLGDRAGTYVNRGIIQSALGDIEEAMADYDRALKIQPELPEAYVGRGNVRFLLSDPAGAIAEYDRALGMEVSRRYAVLLNRGMAFEARGEFDAAERDYREALRLRPDWTLAQSRIDRVLARRKAAAQTPLEP
jgi:tetratricopeptide (TPR) repeat protein